jgi:hypothetical protein
MGSLWPQGGVVGGAASIVASSMTVSLAPGTAAVPLQAGQGAALCRWDAAEVVTIGAAPASGQTRIDLICAQVRDNALDSGGNNDFVMTVTPGTAAASNPATPATPTNAKALWSITVVGASANLAGATLTDLRAKTLRVPGAGELLGCRRVAGASWVVNQGGWVVFNAANGWVGFVAPDSGNVLLSVAAQWANSGAGVQGLIVWSSAATNNTNLITGQAVTGNIDGSSFVVMKHVATGLTPGQSYQAWIQGAYTNAAGAVNLGNGNDVIMEVTALPFSIA